MGNFGSRLLCENSGQKNMDFIMALFLYSKESRGRRVMAGKR